MGQDTLRSTYFSHHSLDLTLPTLLMPIYKVAMHTSLIRSMAPRTLSWMNAWPQVLPVNTAGFYTADDRPDWSFATSLSSGK